jgi:hypothetical protein
LLRLSAFFGPEPIPASFFTAAVELPAPLGTVVTDPVRLHRGLGRIASYGLARLDQSGLQVHRLVQAIVRDRLPAGQRRDDSDCVAALLMAAAPADTDNPPFFNDGQSGSAPIIRIPSLRRRNWPMPTGTAAIPPKPGPWSKTHLPGVGGSSVTPQGQEEALLTPA